MDDSITITWTIHDVHEAVEGLTDEQARQVLQLVKRTHDAEIGICYQTLQDAAQNLGFNNEASQ